MLLLKKTLCIDCTNFSVYFYFVHFFSKSPVKLKIKNCGLNLSCFRAFEFRTSLGNSVFCFDFKSNCYEADIIKMHECLLESVFVVFVGNRQPLNGNKLRFSSSRHLCFHTRSRNCTVTYSRLEQLESRFNFTYRYIDDVLSI